MPKTPRKKARAGRKWSGRVTAHSNALDLDRGVFTWKDPDRIARSLKRSADRSHRRKSEPYRSAMSMLTFYMNRAGSDLDANQRRVLTKAKQALRELYGRDERGSRRKPSNGRSPKRKTSRRKATKRKTTKRKTAKQKPAKS
jgi:uncharacterized protein DUF3175